MKRSEYEQLASPMPGGFGGPTKEVGGGVLGGRAGGELFIVASDR